MIRQLEAKHELHGSVEHMLSPETMSEILGRTVSKVTRVVFEPSIGASDSRFEMVKLDSQQFILKRMTVLSDWLTIGTNDALCRSVKLWQYGVLDKLQPTVDHAIVAACTDSDGYALLMRDVSRDLIKFGRPLTIREVKSLLDALATTHATFWNKGDLLQPELGLTDIKTVIEAFWPDDYRDVIGTENWWGLLLDYVASDVRDTIQSLIDNPEPLYVKLTDFPSILIHGDFKPENLAIIPDTNQVVVFDWQLAGYASPLIDLHWFLTSFVPETPFNGLDYYRQQLAIRLGNRLNQKQWQSMLDVGYLAAILRLGWIHAGGVFSGENHEMTDVHPKYLPSFNNLVRNGVKWL